MFGVRIPVSQPVNALVVQPDSTRVSETRSRGFEPRRGRTGHSISHSGTIVNVSYLAHQPGLMRKILHITATIQHPGSPADESTRLRTGRSRVQSPPGVPPRPRGATGQRAKFLPSRLQVQILPRAPHTNVAARPPRSTGTFARFLEEWPSQAEGNAVLRRRRSNSPVGSNPTSSASFDGGCSQAAKAPGCDPGHRRFESAQPPHPCKR